ncbi:MAG TPA: choice-of-anchor D domain-containing protein [Candidatus Kapabacteria bacterium]|nr:choice-of-anchor D domain-containing protein [Candidatus Kapabacteria bacterium]
MSGHNKLLLAARSLPVISLLLFFSVSAHAVPGITIDSSSLDFGSISITGSKDLTIQVTDTSDADIEIDTLTISGTDAGDFKIITPNAFPIILTAHASIPTSIIIEFGPRSIAPRTALLGIQTSNGPIAIPMKGVGTGISASVALSIAAIDFGLIAPNGVLDDTIELYSDGSDTAIITGIEVSNSSSEIAFEARWGDSTLTPPFEIAPGDSITIIVQFNGLEPLGEKDGVLSIFGNTVTTPTCSLTGSVTWGSFTLLPSTVDFGSMYAGESHDTTVRMTNTGNVDLIVEDILPLVGDFTLINPPSTPFIVHVSESLDFTVHANPSLNSSHSGALQIISRTADPDFAQTNFTVNVLRIPLIAPDTQSSNYACAVMSTIDITIPIQDTGVRSYTLSSVAASDTSVHILTGLPLPASIAAGETLQLPVSFNVPSSNPSGKIVLLFYGGEQEILADTIFLNQIASNTGILLANTINVDTTRAGIVAQSASSITPLGLHILTLHLHSNDTNTAAIVGASIHLPANFSNDSIAIQPSSGGYDITIISPTLISLDAGDSLVTFALQRFVSKIDSTDVTVTADAPEVAGCLVWSPGNSSVPALTACGSDLIQQLLNGSPIIQSISLRDDPIQNSSIQLQIDSRTDASCSCELFSPIGERLSVIPVSLSAGMNVVLVPANELASGPYYLRLVTVAGEAHTVRFVVLH